MIGWVVRAIFGTLAAAVLIVLVLVGIYLKFTHPDMTAMRFFLTYWKLDIATAVAVCVLRLSIGGGEE